MKDRSRLTCLGESNVGAASADLDRRPNSNVRSEQGTRNFVTIGNVRFTSIRDIPRCLNCANSGHSRTAWRTGQIDPERPFEVSPMNRRYAAQCGHRRNGEIAPGAAIRGSDSSSSAFVTLSDASAASTGRALECRSLRDNEVLTDWAEGKRGQVLQQRHDRDHGQQESDEQRAVSGHGPGRWLRLLFGGQ
jgi:hypothetical protein